MSTLSNRQAGRIEGERRRDAAFDCLEASRDVLIGRARRALLMHLLIHGDGTIDDVAKSSGTDLDPIDRRWRGTVPGLLVQSGVIRDSGRMVKSSRPQAHGRKITVWELADEPAARSWLARHRDIPESDRDPATSRMVVEPAAVSQMTLW
jgi:hypothetical protein